MWMKEMRKYEGAVMTLSWESEIFDANTGAASTFLCPGQSYRFSESCLFHILK